MFITFVLEREYNRLVFPLHYNNRGACKQQAEIIPVKPDPDNAGVGNCFSRKIHRARLWFGSDQ